MVTRLLPLTDNRNNALSAPLVFIFLDWLAHVQRTSPMGLLWPWLTVSYQNKCIFTDCSVCFLKSLIWLVF